MVIREKPKGMVVLNKINDDSISEKDSEEEKDTENDADISENDNSEGDDNIDNQHHTITQQSYLHS